MLCSIMLFKKICVFIPPSSSYLNSTLDLGSPVSCFIICILGGRGEVEVSVNLLNVIDSLKASLFALYLPLLLKQS